MVSEFLAPCVTFFNLLLQRLGFGSETKPVPKILLEKGAKVEDPNTKEAKEEILERDALLIDVEPKDLVEFGFIPEFVGNRTNFNFIFLFLSFCYVDVLNHRCINVLGLMGDSPRIFYIPQRKDPSPIL